MSPWAHAHLQRLGHMKEPRPPAPRLKTRGNAKPPVPERLKDLWDGPQCPGSYWDSVAFSLPTRTMPRATRGWGTSWLIGVVFLRAAKHSVHVTGVARNQLQYRRSYVFVVFLPGTSTECYCSLNLMRGVSSCLFCLSYGVRAMGRDQCGLRLLWSPPSMIRAASLPRVWTVWQLCRQTIPLH